MSIQNGRLYQYALEKLRFAPLALLCAGTVRACVRGGLWASAYLRPGKRRAPSPAAIQAARARLSAAFPKPALTRTPAMAAEGQGTVDLSIIVPVYNVGEFFAPCMESIYSQETRYSYEVILIDDGSTAETAARAAQYAGRPGTLLLRQENQGAAAARNNGLDHARGEYIMFVDADDLLLPGAIESLMNGAKAQNADFVQGGWSYVDGPRQVFPDALYTGEKRMALIDLPGMPWGKVIRRSLFAQMRFPAGYTSYVDTPIKCLTLRMSARAATVQAVVYAWRRNPGGITFTSKRTPRALQTYWIMEQMQEDSRALSLPEDALYRAIWLRQMLSVNYDRLKGLEDALVGDVFLLSCDFLSPILQATEKTRLPFMLRLGRRAFARMDESLWRRLGRWYTLSV